MTNMRLRLKYKSYCFGDPAFEGPHSFDEPPSSICTMCRDDPVFYDQRVKIPDDAVLCEKKEIYKECNICNPPYTLLNTTRIFFPSLPKPITIIDGHIIGNIKYCLHRDDPTSGISIDRREISLKTTDEKGVERFLGGCSLSEEYLTDLYSKPFFFSVNAKKIIQRQKLFLELKLYGKTLIMNNSCVYIYFYNNMEIDIPVI